MSSRPESAPDQPLLATRAAGGRGRAARWLPWAVGGAALAAVVVAATHFSEERAFARLLEQADPWWLVAALALQGATYLAQSQIWRDVTAAGASRLPVRTTYGLTLAKLFVDQALPSAGVSGTAVLAHGLERAGVAESVVMAGVVVSTTAFYAANVLALAVALVIAASAGHASAIVLAASALFIGFGVALAVALLLLAGRRHGRAVGFAARVPVLGRLVGLVRAADPRLARSPRLLARAAAWQLAIVALDAATLWTFIRSLGHTASPGGVFASFMISTVARTVSPIPAGLGVFEAASVVTLRLIGVPLAVALSATLLFHGCTFWLPMVPGLLVARRLRRPT
ncbi:MAG TPA: lysylphosphatidylglycerol synthase transmembrane domain-containing protein [Kofleriaceae bacterium]|nr:lysylphosphatidylglycerol synthase transmembrane domain-containing protein [Kofleriaceae bacterium]